MEKSEKATFAAGCFWGVESAFRKVKGILSTQVGYAGGHSPNPTYQDVCANKTGHAESIEVTFDPEHISYDELLEIFWKMHDPTTSNRQGPDIGSQYRSIIFFHTEDQQKKAIASKEKLENARVFSKPIVTEIIPAAPFYRAEEYHQQYHEKQ